MKKIALVAMLLPMVLHAQDTWETLLKKAFTLVERKQYERAIEHAEQARDLVYTAFGDQSAQAFEVHATLEFLYEERGFMNKAAALYHRDKQFLEAKEKTQLPLYAEILTSLALLYEKFGEYRQAETMYQQVLATLESRGEKNTLQYHQNLRYYANIQFRLGQLDKAEKMYLQVLEWETAHLHPMHLQRSITLNNLAMVQMNRKNYTEARSYFHDALEITERTYTSSSGHYASMLGNLAILHYEKGKQDSSALLLEKALNIRAKVSGKNHPECGRLLTDLGNVARDLGKNKEAEKHYKEALTILAKDPGEKSPAYLNALFHYTLFLEKNSAYEIVLPQYQKMLGLIQHQVQAVFPGLSENEKASFYQNFIPRFSAFRSYCLREINSHPEISAALYDHLLFSKGLIADAQRQVISASALAEQPDLRLLYTEWQAARTRYARAIQMPANERAEKGIDLPALENEINLLEKQLASISVEYSANRNSTVRWQDIQAKLQPGEAAIELMRLAKGQDIQYAALILLPESALPQLVLFPEGRALESRHIRFYQNAIRYQLPDTLSYTAFWKPLEEYLQQSHTLYFSPDGVFNQISPATLFDTEQESYLADRHAFRLVNSTRWISNQYAAITGDNAVLLGSPQFYSSISASQPAAASTERKALLGVTEISALPGTLDEVNQIAQILQTAGTSVQSHTAAAATEAAVKSLRSPAILHVATHGFFAPIAPAPTKPNWSAANVSGSYANPMLRSGLLLSGAGSWLDGEADHTEDGILTAYEVIQLQLRNTGLVVLSACETGLGEIQHGEGVYGLQRAFMLAGAQNVVMSLWKVDDQATSQLMTFLYQQLTFGQPLSEAFQTAQRQLRQQYPQPYYWGAFVVK